MESAESAINRYTVIEARSKILRSGNVLIEDV